ncbi:hypothetical protein [Actinoplanes siamensis]|uniref:hypothetical protein n=1 Tax=Actinoplanes siamensis TaxID=1223317 RepID=UPI001943BEAD|nr:hypothetical protein [Actinoplanes siamensis]
MLGFLVAGFVAGFVAGLVAGGLVVAGVVVLGLVTAGLLAGLGLEVTVAVVAAGSGEALRLTGAATAGRVVSAALVTAGAPVNALMAVTPPQQSTRTPAATPANTFQPGFLREAGGALKVTAPLWAISVMVVDALFGRRALAVRTTGTGPGWDVGHHPLGRPDRVDGRQARPEQHELVAARHTRPGAVSRCGRRSEPVSSRAGVPGRLVGDDLVVPW